MNNNQTNTPSNNTPKKKLKFTGSQILIAAIAAVAVVVGILLWIQYSKTSAANDEIEQLRLENEQLQLANEY